MAEIKPTSSQNSSNEPSVFQGEIVFEEFTIEIGTLTSIQREAVRGCLSREACKSGIDIPFTGGDSGGDTGLTHATELQNSDYGPES